MEPRHKSFKELLKEGEEGEKQVAEFLIKQGYSCLPFYQFESLSSAPMVLSKDQNIISPDLLMLKKDKTFWLEVKTKNRWSKNKNREPETGCDYRSYKHYMNIKKITGLDVWLAFNHREDNLNHIYVLNTDIKYTRYWDGINEHNGRKVTSPKVLWSKKRLTKIK